MISIVQPRTPEEVDAVAADILQVARYFPTFEPDYLDYMRDFPGQMTLIYVGDEPAGYIEIRDCRSFQRLGTGALEFGGAVVPAHRDKLLTAKVAPVAIRLAFLRTGAKTMLAATQLDNKPARHALAGLGFALKRTDAKKAHYALTRGQALGQSTQV